MVQQALNVVPGMCRISEFFMISGLCLPLCQYASLSLGLLSKNMQSWAWPVIGSEILQVSAGLDEVRPFRYNAWLVRDPIPSDWASGLDLWPHLTCLYPRHGPKLQPICNRHERIYTGVAHTKQERAITVMAIITVKAVIAQS